MKAILMVGLVQEIEDGFDLVGISGESEALPPDFQPASISQEELLASSERSNKAVIHSTKGSGSDLIDSELWAKTMEEVGKGLADWTPYVFSDTRSCLQKVCRGPIPKGKTSGQTIAKVK